MANISPFELASHNPSPIRKKGRGIIYDSDFPNCHLFDGSSASGSSPSSEDSQNTIMNNIGQLQFDTYDEIDSNFNTLFSPVENKFKIHLSDDSSKEKDYSDDHIKSTEQKIDLTPSIKNCFLRSEETRNQSYFTGNKTTIWLTPLQERPTYMLDFEHEGILGKGTFSTVFKARKRLDGCIYAIKKIDKKITNSNAKINSLKEVCALAAFQNCPRIIRYFGCWIEDSQLWIQMELCLKVI